MATCLCIPKTTSSISSVYMFDSVGSVILGVEEWSRVGSQVKNRESVLIPNTNSHPNDYPTYTFLFSLFAVKKVRISARLLLNNPLIIEQYITARTCVKGEKGIDSQHARTWEMQRIFGINTSCTRVLLSSILHIFSILQIWMCGGNLEVLPCSVVGHIFRQSSPIKWKGQGFHILSKNLIRVAEVWMDDYKDIFYRINGKKAVGEQTKDICVCFSYTMSATIVKGEKWTMLWENPWSSAGC